MSLFTLVNIGLGVSIFFLNFDKSNLTNLNVLKIGFFFLQIMITLYYDCVVKELKILDIVLCFTAHSNRIIFNNYIVTILYKSTPYSII